MRTTATNRKVRILLRAIDDGSLIPRPEFQRRLVWSRKHKNAFIRTILDGYPFPEIFIAAADVDEDSAEGSEMLVDGQQRLTTISQYFHGSPELVLEKDVIPYSELSSIQKRNFLEYEVVVRDLGEVTISEVKEVFTRINSTNYSLNAIEINNARYEGAFKEFCVELAQNDFFTKHQVFTATDGRRMLDVRFCLILVATIMEGYFHRDREIEQYLKMYDDEFPDASKTMSNIIKVLKFIERCNFPDTCRVYKKADIFTLIVELYYVLIKQPVKLKAFFVRTKLNSFYISVDKKDHEEGSAAQTYYFAALQASNDRNSRINRGKIVREVLMSSAE